MSSRRWSRHPALIFLFVFSAGLTVFLVHSTGIFSDDQDYCSVPFVHYMMFHTYPECLLAFDQDAWC